MHNVCMAWRSHKQQTNSLGSAGVEHPAYTNGSMIARKSWKSTGIEVSMYFRVVSSTRTSTTI
jgi:hypothetical protein